VRFRNVGELVEHTNGLLDYPVLSRAFRQLTRYYNDVRTIELAGDGRKLATFGLYRFIVIRVSKSYVLDGVDRIRLDVVFREKRAKLNDRAIC
jgi:hypothetical protein